MPIPAPALKYLIDGIEGTPGLFKALLAKPGIDWDARPDAARFTLREMVAHVADWDPIWIERVTRARDEENPQLPSVDEGMICESKSYATQDPTANLQRLSDTRPLLVGLLRSLPPESWDRPLHREFVGDLTLQQLAMMILGHDSYHLRQAADFVG